MTKDGKGIRKNRVYSVSSSDTERGAVVSPATVPLAARFATTPSFVEGVYAPPANV